MKRSMTLLSSPSLFLHFTLFSHFLIFPRNHFIDSLCSPSPWRTKIWVLPGLDPYSPKASVLFHSCQLQLYQALRRSQLLLLLFYLLLRKLFYVSTYIQMTRRIIIFLPRLFFKTSVVVPFVSLPDRHRYDNFFPTLITLWVLITINWIMYVVQLQMSCSVK